MSWTPINYPPPQSGHYLVYQEREDDYRRYRFVRYWNGQTWNNPNEEKYGTVRYWCALPALPEGW